MMKYLLSSLAISTGLALSQTSAAFGLNLFSSQISQVSSTRLDSRVIHFSSNQPKNHYAQTQFPIFMVHGFGLGFSRIGNDLAGIDQFYQIPSDLARHGASVFVAEVSIVESNAVRGEQALAQLDEALAITGKSKVNLIGHSHGGPTIRYMEIIAPQKIASMTGIAGTFKGSPVADTMLGNPILSAIGKPIIGGLVANALQLLEGNSRLSVNYDAAMYDLSEEGSAIFNARFPSAAIPSGCNTNGAKITQNGIYHYSWSGSSKITNLIDPDTLLITVTSALMPKERNHDGLVPICSSNYGQVIRNDYNLNHIDEANQLFGLKGWFAPDPVQIFREHANRLKLQGL